MKPRTYALALILTLVLAANLRFAHLGWGLRHAPHADEQVFVENSARMLAEGDLDHRYYKYPGLFFYLAALTLAGTGVAGSPASPEAYLVVRGLAAAFGVLSVFLVARLGRRLLGVWGGLAAALFLAVSPVEVRVAHTLHLDIALEALTLVVFLSLGGIGRRPAGDALAGVTLGAATALKFTGLLAFPSYLVKRALEPGPRVGGVVLAGLSALLTLLLLTPYAFIHAREFTEGATTQWTYHYRTREMAIHPGMLLTYGEVLRQAFGPALVLALGAVSLVRSRWREWLPLLIYPVLTVLVFSTSTVRHERFMVPALGVVALLCGAGVEWIARRHRTVAALALLAAWPSLQASGRYLEAVRGPIVRDQVVDWVATHVPERASVFCRDDGLGVDRERFDVLTPTGRPRADARLQGRADFVIAAPVGPAQTPPGRLVFRSDPRVAEHGPPLAVYARGDSRSSPLTLTPSQLRASEQEAQLFALLDDRTDTEWTTAGAQESGEFLEVILKAPRRISRIELRQGAPQRWGRILRIYAARGGEPLRPLAVEAANALAGRRALGRQVSAQLFFLDPVCVDRVRIVQEGRSSHSWAVAELRLEAEEDPEGAPPCLPVRPVSKWIRRP
jgi:hypothetical protein